MSKQTILKSCVDILWQILAPKNNLLWHVQNGTSQLFLDIGYGMELLG